MKLVFKLIGADKRQRACAPVIAIAAMPLILAACGGGSSKQPEAPVAATEPKVFNLQEATISQMQQAMEAGAISSVELTALYLNRIHAYDLNGIKLNSIPVLNPAVLDEAKKADEQRAAGTVLGPLHGVPYTVKDSYKVAGLTVASGSPAFANLTAKEDAFTVSRIRQSGGVLIGKTNMPPLAAGGMQRGVYGRAESPYNAEYLTAAWFSGSSNGSATSTAANFAAFGMGEETVSSGRSPASNNALVAYTPSRGVISIRGNWPLFPVRDVVVPHTRTVEDLMRVLDVIVAEDVVTKGDFWRHQTAVKLPKVVDVRPKSYLELKDAAALKGKRIGVPRMYIGKDFGGTNPIRVRPSIVALWEKAAADLRAQGAEVIEVDFPVQNNYDGDRVGAQTMYERGLVPYAWQEQEFVYVTAYSFEEFLQGVGDANFPSMTQVNPALLFPNPPGSVDERRGVELFPSASLIDTVKAGVRPVADLPHFAEALQGLENTRKVDLEDWMKSNKLDLVVFPANANIGKANADVNDASYDEAWENGNYFSNMNYTLRDLGIPSVSVSMGVMKDTGMPVNLTFIGPAYSDSKLIRYAYAYESATHNRAVATRVAPLADEMVDYADGKSIPPGKRSDKLPPVQTLNASIANGVLALAGTSRDASKLGYTHVYVNGSKVTPTGTLNDWTGQVNVAKYRSGAYAAKSLFILVLSKDAYGNASATTASVALPPL